MCDFKYNVNFGDIDMKTFNLLLMINCGINFFFTYNVCC